MYKRQVYAEVKDNTERENGPDYVCTKIIKQIEALDTIVCDGLKGVSGIGIGVPGPVDTVKGTMIMATNLPGFEDYPICDKLSERFGLPVFIDNDANVAGLAEAILGAGKDYPTCYYVTISTGIGGAFIADGKLISGGRGHAGEIGNIIVKNNGYKFGSLNPGAAEGEASGTAITRKGKELLGEDKVNHAGDVFKLASEGNLKAQSIVCLLYTSLIHFPCNNDDIEEALRYLKYEEFLKFQLTMQYIKLSRKKNIGVKKQFDQQILTQFINQLPFKLTPDQNAAVDEIINDLKKDTIMYRFIQGDVGSGKTVVGAIGLYANYLAGFQGAMMAPTEILASQHFKSLNILFKETGINLALLTGRLSNKEKQNIYQDLDSGKINIVVGTHALFQDKVSYQKLGLVITDEQHRFGVNQRKALKEKGQQVD